MKHIQHAIVLPRHQLVVLSWLEGHSSKRTNEDSGARSKAPFQYPKRRLLDLVKSRSHEIDTLNCRVALKFDRHIGHCCRSACQISDIRQFHEALRDLTERRLFGYWDGAQVVHLLCHARSLLLTPKSPHQLLVRSSGVVFIEFLPQDVASRRRLETGIYCDLYDS